MTLRFLGCGQHLDGAAHANYGHPVWGKYAAITENSYGKGLATYIGCRTSKEVVEKIVVDAVKKAGL